MKKIFYSAMLILTMTSCATIVKGSKQTVKAVSKSGKEIVVYDKYGNEFARGKGTLEVKLPKSSGYSISHGSKENSYTIKTNTETKQLLPYTNIYYLLNSFNFSFGIGHLVDEITGAKYTLEYNDQEASILNFE